jgi:hypothetical protein
LWRRGDWWALLTAIGFAAVLNGALVCTFAWPAWLPAWVTFFGWILIAILWASLVWHEFHCLPALRGGQDAAAASLLAKAQQEYLKRDWFETEVLLQRVLRDDRDDVDARLMLATLYRHTGRLEEADETLSQLERMEGAGKWKLEISRERNLISELGSKSETDRDGCPVSLSEPNR